MGRKLIQINATCNWGSTGRITEQIGLLAKENGWESYIVHGARYVRESKLNSIQVAGKFDNYIHVVISKLFGGHGLGSYFATRKLIIRLRDIKPDVIHLHNIHGYYLNYPLLFKYLKDEGIPVVWTLHDCWSMTGHCAHFDGFGCERWKTHCFNCPQKKAQYGTILLNMASRNYELKKKYFSSLSNLTIVTVSEWLKGIVKDSFLKNKKIVVLNNGIDLSVFRPIYSDLRRKLGIQDNKKILLGVATYWDNEKGLREFFELSKFDNYQIILIGLTSKQLKDLPSEIIGIERTSNQQELIEYYTMADMLVNPTYNDSFPTVNIEALACGTPVVTYRTGGSPEILSSDTGYVVNRGDFEALKDAINSLLGKGKLFYSCACIERARNYFNKDERFLDYIKLYNQILNKQ